MDPEKLFTIRTAKNPVYVAHEASQASEKVDDGHDINEKIVDVTDDTVSHTNNVIQLKDHFFDSPDRTRAKPIHKPKGVSGWLEPARDVHGVRSHYKVDESKLSTLARMGYSVVDNKST